jgi:hypothetical protein
MEIDTEDRSQNGNGGTVRWKSLNFITCGRFAKTGQRLDSEGRREDKRNVKRFETRPAR